MFHTTLPEPGRKLGGVEVAVDRLANELAKDDRDEVTVLSLGDAPEGARYKHRRVFERGAALGSSRIARLVLLPIALNSLDFDEFDVVHFQGDDWFFVRRGRFARVRTLNGSALDEARTATSWKRRLVQYAVYPLERLSAGLADQTLALGPRTASMYGAETVVDYGVDEERFRPGTKAEVPTILFVGTWHGRKRGRFLYQKFIDEVAPTRPTARLVMVTDEIPDHAHSQVDWIRFPSDEQLAELYRSAWIFAYPSLYEGFGLPYVEAMASGTAIVCSDNEGARHVLDDGRTGSIVDDREFGVELDDLLGDDARRGDLARSGLERASWFTWDRIAAEHRAVYERVTADGPVRSRSSRWIRRRR